MLGILGRDMRRNQGRGDNLIIQNGDEIIQRARKKYSHGLCFNNGVKVVLLT